MAIYKSKEDGQLTTWKEGMRMDDYEILSYNEILDCIDAAPTWDSIDPEVYKGFCDSLDIDYESYSDPDELFQAMSDAVKKRTLSCDDAEEIVVSDKEFDGISDWNERFCDFLRSRGLEPYEWDGSDLGEFWRFWGYETETI
jgi:hypothetical protein